MISCFIMFIIDCNLIRNIFIIWNSRITSKQ